MYRKLQFALPTLLLLGLTGCSAPYPPRPQTGTAEYRQTKFVVIQYCLPSAPNVKILSLGTVDRWGYEAWQRSYGSGAREVTDRTSANQPVFVRSTDKRPIDLLAVTTWRDDIEFVYVPPRDIGNSWTEWLPPTAAAPAQSNAKYRILYNQPYEKVAIPVDAPRVRYRLRSYEDEQAESLVMSRRNSQLPCN